MHGSNELTDEQWQQLRAAGTVEPPEVNVFDSARDSYLARVADGGNLGAASPARKRTTSVIWASGTAAAVAGVLALSFATGGLGPDNSTVSAASPSASAQGGPTNDDTGPRLVVEMGDRTTASLSGAYGAPSFDAFTRTSLIDDVIEGTVIGAESTMVRSRDDAEVMTRLRVNVTRSRVIPAGTSVTILQPGGVVTRGELERDFAGKFTQLNTGDPDAAVEVRVNGQVPHSVDDRIVAAVSESPGGSVVLVSLLADASGERYSWTAGTPDNRRWSDHLDRADVESLYR